MNLTQFDISSGKRGIERHRLFEGADDELLPFTGGFESRVAQPPPAGGAQIQIIRGGIARELLREREFLLGRNRRGKPLRDLRREVGLPFEPIAVVADGGLGGALEVGRGVGHFHQNEDFAPGAAHTARDHVGDAELGRDWLEVTLRRITVGQHGGARGDFFESADPGERCEQHVVHGVGEEFVFLLRAPVFEGPHGDGLGVGGESGGRGLWLAGARHYGSGRRRRGRFFRGDSREYDCDERHGCGDPRPGWSCAARSATGWKARVTSGAPSNCRTRPQNAGSDSAEPMRVHCTALNSDGTVASASRVASITIGSRNVFSSAIGCVRWAASFHSRRK